MTGRAVFRLLVEGRGSVLARPLAGVNGLHFDGNVCGCNNRWLNGVDVRRFGTQEQEPKQSLLQRFKSMYKDYWYVLVPVHLATSACWLGGFYYLAKSGIDVPALMHSYNFPEKFIDKLRDSSMGYVAVTYALYKIATPARYTVTLGGTTISINYLKKWGYIRPVPSREKLREMYEEKKESLMTNVKDKTCELKMKKAQLKDEVDRQIEKMKPAKDGVKQRQ